MLDQLNALGVVEGECGLVFVHELGAVLAERFDRRGGSHHRGAGAVLAERGGCGEELVHVLRQGVDAALGQDLLVVVLHTGVEVPREGVGAFLDVLAFEGHGIP